MAVLIRAHIDRATGICALRFPYEEHTKDLIKRFGARWRPEIKAWTCPINMVPVLRSAGLQITEINSGQERTAQIPAVIKDRLRDYQIKGAELLIKNRSFLLSMDPRTGKTPTLIAAACSLMSAGIANACVIFYPASVVGEWERQLKEFANVNLVMLEGRKEFTAEALWDLWGQQYFFIGCNYDILGERNLDLHKLLAGKNYITIADEVQCLQNRKIRRTKAAFSLSHGLGAHAAWYSKAEEEEIIRGPFEIMDGQTGELYWVHEGKPIASWGSTGTPMRNTPRNLWGVMHFCQQGTAGTYRSFTERYADGKLDDLGHWDDSGKSNEEELAVRLAAMSYRKTRAEVAQWLPKSDRAVIICSMRAEQMKAYRKLEQHFAPSASVALNEDGSNQSTEASLRELVHATSNAKIATAFERIAFHLERGVKVVCFAHFHETLSELEKEYGSLEYDGPQAYCAGGWKTPSKRREIIDQWKSYDHPSVLLVNSLSSGTGIDLSDAEVAIFLELEWVPADFIQAEARIQDVHLGKRSTPPIYEYLIVKDTIDEAMAKALIEKTNAIQTIVGVDDEAIGAAKVLRNAEIGSSELGLANNSRETVLAALRSISERWGTITNGDGVTSVDIAEVFEEEEKEEEEEEESE